MTVFCIYDVVYAIMYFLSALTFYCFQALCILANVGDGDRAKDFIMGNEDVLKKLMNYMVRSVAVHYKHKQRNKSTHICRMLVVSLY